MFVSYAQNLEDVILWRALKQVERGFYIDIGAQDPVVDSVSLGFYEWGWRGVHIQPSTKYAEKLRAARSDEEVIQAAVSLSGRHVTLCEIHTIDSSLVTGQSRQTGFEVGEVMVRCFTLLDILDRYEGRDIHWLRIDAKAVERGAIESWQASLVRPWIVVVESGGIRRPLSELPEWEPLLIKRGYEFVYFDGVNRFYISVERPELRESFGSGPNVFDDFVLSGLSDAPFCARLNAEASDLRQQLILRQRETDASRQKLAGLDGKLAELEASLPAARAELEASLAASKAVHRSTSWRITAPFRSVSRTARWFANGAWSWITLKPGCRPRRMARRMSNLFLGRRDNSPVEPRTDPQTEPEGLQRLYWRLKQARQHASER